MTLCELINALHVASSDPVVVRLAKLLEDWRAGASNTEQLRQSVEHYIGNSWIASEDEHKTVYSLWSAFRDDCIAGRLRMTINERLHSFDLLAAWDGARTEADRTLVRQKVDFNPPNP